MLSNKTRYALKAVLMLAEKYDLKQALLGATIAEEENIPKKFLESILLELKNNGILHSKKGKGGGYTLAKHPNLISVGSIIRIFEGPLSFLPCLSKSAYRKCDECTDEKSCKVRIAMKEVCEFSRNILDTTMLQEVLDKSRREKLEVMYFI